MIIHLWKCDGPGCGKEYRANGGAQIEFHVDNESDPVDGHNIRVYKHADLCMACMCKLISKMLECATRDHRAKLAKDWGAV